MDQTVTLDSTISLAAAASTPWDTIVIGAGPAGAVAATLLARRGRRVLLVEAKRYPRPKVCGGCLSASAVAALAEHGLDNVLRQIGAQPIHHVRLHWQTAVSELRLPAGYTVDRAKFDAALVQAAIRAGAAFLDECAATLESLHNDHWVLRLNGPHTVRFAEAQVAIAADGLLRASLRKQANLASHALPNSRVGAAAIVRWEAEMPLPGGIEMTIGRCGYAGAVRLDSARLLVAAALDAPAVRQQSVGAAVQTILSSGQALPVAIPKDVAWNSVPALTRRPTDITGERWFAIGDAAGYVEPFTGDGMAIAIESAIAVTPLAAAGCTAWRRELASAWQVEHQRLVRRRQFLCRGLAWALRRPWAVRGVMEFCRRAPFTARTALAQLQQRPQCAMRLGEATIA